MEGDRVTSLKYWRKQCVSQKCYTHKISFTYKTTIKQQENIYMEKWHNFFHLTPFWRYWQKDFIQPVDEWRNKDKKEWGWTIEYKYYKPWKCKNNVHNKNW